MAIPGSGKTHVFSAISHELIRSGRRVYFRNCGLMVQDLLAAKRDLKLSGLFKKLSRYEVLVLDDLGYVQQSRECFASPGNGETPHPSYTTTRQESHHAEASEELYAC